MNLTNSCWKKSVTRKPTVADIDKFITKHAATEKFLGLVITS